MTKDQAIATLRRGPDGVTEWNQRRTHGEQTPDLSGAILNAVNLSGADLSKVNLFEVKFNSSILAFADLRDAYLADSQLMHANLQSARLDRACLSGAWLQSATLDQATLFRTNFLDALLNGAGLVGVEAIEANFWGANLSGADCTDANFEGSRFERAILVGTQFNNANLAGCWIHGISAWDIKGTPRRQSGLVIESPVSGTKITVDDLEVAQFIYLLLNNDKIRNVIDTIGKKCVLILGRFTEERKSVLDAVREKLRELDFLPIVVDFKSPTHRDFTETIKTLAGLSRFIIADITNPKSSPLELQATVPDYMIPFVPIIQEDEEPFAMFRDLRRKYGEWVLDVLKYDSADGLIKVLERAVVAPALERSDQLLRRKTEKLLERHVRDYDH
jgi:uncharacterized protein YjbI with pentapeptide repeats